MNDMDWPITEGALNRSAGAARPREAEALFRERSGGSEELYIVGPKAIARSRKRPPRARAARRAGLLLGAGVLGLLLFGSVARMTRQSGSSITAPLPRASDSSSAVVSLPPPNLFKPISPEEAARQNAERPFVNRPDTPAGRFVLRTDADDRERAINCLTQAVYYEAASEGPDGGRAVAQVVLNRMRHPGYPASVCGVVYQGGDRAYGCQFTFVCDGSLLRVPIASLWTRSRKIAEDALAGKVFAPVGHATHYHADYVLPYWADSLDKTVQIGRHIFYRLRSTPGDSRSFFQRYAGAEPELPKLADTATSPPAGDTEQLANALLTDGLKGSTPDVERAAPTASPLIVDATPTKLIADEVGAVATTRKKISSDCSATSGTKKLMPLGTTDMRASSSGSSC